jgi:hypothetical protein
MPDAGRNKRLSTTEHLWSLQKEGRQISFLLTDLDSGAFELKLTWSDKPSRSVQIFSVREDAMAEARRQLRTYMTDGWAVHGEPR